MASFKTSGNKGFHLTFPNGLTLSTQFGYGNYCGDYPNQPLFKAEEFFQRKDTSSDDVEIAIISPDGAWITNQYDPEADQVLGYVTMDRWLDIVAWCRAWKPP
jgi:hypothetical protein